MMKKPNKKPVYTLALLSSFLLLYVSVLLALAQSFLGQEARPPSSSLALADVWDVKEAQTYVMSQHRGDDRMPLFISSTEIGDINSTQRSVVVAYAISLIKCSDFQSSTVGMVDAALILRHSIHHTSVRNPNSGSKYDYKMYALVHEQAAHCAQPLADAGFTLVVRPAPVKINEIRGEHLRKHIHKEWCCGADEFIKLYSYMLPEKIVVHMDIDFVMHKPMDALFDVLLEGPDSPSRDNVPLEIHKNAFSWNTISAATSIDAFMTRDWPQVMPGRKPGYQAGFIVHKPDAQVFEEVLEVLREGNYVEGFQRENGWGGLGYGGYVGAMAMQGLLAYYYDQKRPHSWMELNQCRFNHLGMDVLYRAMPSFNPRHAKRGQCRNDGDYCEDCMHTNVTGIYNIHYAMCRKPWNCIGEHSNTRKGSNHVPTVQVDYEHCMELETIWHSYRTDFEAKLFHLTGDETIRHGQEGHYMQHVFQGHCANNTMYLSIGGNAETRRRVPELYEVNGGAMQTKRISGLASEQ